MLEVFVSNLETACGVAPGDSAIVAVSGGADSTALLDLLRRASGPLRLGLSVVTLDHRLRPGSAAEAREVVRLAAGLGLPAIALEVDPRSRARLEGLGLEEAARLERREALEATRRRLGAAWVALGHSRDDQAETVLQRLHRGTGLDGLAAMAARAGSLVRPLLWARRAELRDYLAGRGLGWLEDPSNRERAFERNVVRQDLLPQLEAEGLAALADEARGLRAVLRAGDRAGLRRCARTAGGLLVARGRFMVELPDATLSRLARSAVDLLPGLRHPLPRSRTEELVRVLGGERAEVHLPGLRAQRTGGSRPGAVLAAGLPPAPGPEASLVLDRPGLSRSEALLLAVEVGDRPASPLWAVVPAGERYEVRAPRAGDRIAGSGTTLGRRLARQGLGRMLRPFVPVLARGPEVLWAGIGPRPAGPGLRGRETDGACWVISLRLDRSHPLRAWTALVGAAGAPARSLADFPGIYDEFLARTWRVC